MDFTLSPETDNFRKRIRIFVEDKLLPLESDPAMVRALYTMLFSRPFCFSGGFFVEFFN